MSFGGTVLSRTGFGARSVLLFGGRSPCMGSQQLCHRPAHGDRKGTSWLQGLGQGFAGTAHGDRGGLHDREVGEQDSGPAPALQIL